MPDRNKRGKSADFNRLATNDSPSPSAQRSECRQSPHALSGIPTPERNDQRVRPRALRYSAGAPILRPLQAILTPFLNEDGTMQLFLRFLTIIGLTCVMPVGVIGQTGLDRSRGPAGYHSRQLRRLDRSPLGRRRKRGTPLPSHHPRPPHTMIRISPQGMPSASSVLHTSRYSASPDQRSISGGAVASSARASFPLPSRKNRAHA